MEHTEQELVRREKLDYLVSKGINPFGSRFDVTSNSKEIKEACSDKTNEELEKRTKKKIKKHFRKLFKCIFKVNIVFN